VQNVAKSSKHEKTAIFKRVIFEAKCPFFLKMVRKKNGQKMHHNENGNIKK
jgi:hypothetical protein